MGDISADRWSNGQDRIFNHLNHFTCLFVEILKTEEEGAVSEPGHDGLGHPLEVHIAGQHRQVRVRYACRGRGRLPVRYQHVYE
jgi:hypothetical protein